MTRDSTTVASSTPVAPGEGEGIPGVFHVKHRRAEESTVPTNALLTTARRVAKGIAIITCSQESSPQPLSTTTARTFPHH
ncbi:hypothetical protein [Demequina oxidasica]|uniref:hypothetical protein n=1 Tax=Demequina oxidasica TaxID=676199 RepID=UPI000782D12E|nr:hypothetical protein [Demequina oxidasica]